MPRRTAKQNAASRRNLIKARLHKSMLKTTNPTGSVFVKYNPASRTGRVSSKLKTLDKFKGVSPRQLVTVYRGAPKNQTKIVAGDFITTNKQLARDYAGTGKVLQLKVPYSHVIADSDWEGEEYIYRPRKQSARRPVNHKNLAGRKVKK